MTKRKSTKEQAVALTLLHDEIKTQQTLATLHAEVVKLREAQTAFRTELNLYVGPAASIFAGELERVKSAHSAVAGLFVTMREFLKRAEVLFSEANGALKSCVSYTQEEVSKMSAEQYRERILLPLGLGKKL